MSSAAGACIIWTERAPHPFTEAHPVCKLSVALLQAADIWHRLLLSLHHCRKDGSPEVREAVQRGCLA